MTLGGVLDEVIDLVVHVELGQHVAGEELALDRDLLAAAGLGHGLGRDLDRLDQLGEAEPVGVGQDLVADLVLETGIGVDDVPAGHVCISVLKITGRG